MKPTGHRRDAPYSSATTIAEKSSRSTMSAASRATSDPFPIAIPQSAARNAGASLTPSPVTATTPPRACIERTMRSFCSGVVRAKTISWYEQRTSSRSGVSASSSTPVTTMLCGGSLGSCGSDISAFSLSLNELRSSRSDAWCTVAGFVMMPACVAMATAVAGWSPVTTKKRIPAPRHILKGVEP
jgi:hypothetical protein